MENKIRNELEIFLTRLETRHGRIAEKLYIKVKDDYLKRLEGLSGSGHEGVPINPALKRLFEKLADVMDEILLRVFTGEFTNDELLEGIRHLDLFSGINDLITLFNSLESFKTSIQSITELETVSEDDETPEDASSLDIDDVIADFDSIDIFADYEEGDELYDSQYEEEDRWVLNELFLHIMDGYIEPIVVGLRSAMGGNKSTELFNALLASLRPLLRSAETMGFVQMGTALARLDTLLTRAAEKGAMNSKLRIATIQAYGELKKHLPDSGKSSGLMDLIDLDMADSSFLLALTVDTEIDDWMVQTLVEVGINSRDKLKVASVNEISDVTGLSFDKSMKLLNACRKIVTV